MEEEINSFQIFMTGIIFGSLIGFIVENSIEILGFIIFIMLITYGIEKWSSKNQLNNGGKNEKS